ncbi:MAG: lycopene cyclase domain-containing protein [Actinomycetia bacterium]|nr:lycopene cyclase domain-containing protein [Actinomycetes bacterium]
MTYAGVLLFIVLGSVWLEFVFKLGVFRQWKRLLGALLIGITPFIVWDLWAVRADHWSFDPAQVAAFRLPGELPLEEFLFFPIVGLAGILTYEGVTKVRSHFQSRSS